MSSAPLHSAVWANHLVNELKLKGVPIAPLLAEAGIEPRTLNKEDARIPFDQVAALFERAAEMSGDESLGFHLSQRREARDAGLITYVGLSAPTVGDGIRNVVRYRRVFSDAGEMDDDSLYKDGRLSWWFRVPASTKRRQYVEWGASGFMKTLRSLTNRTIRPVTVTFVHPRNSNLREYERFFGCPVVFGAEENVIQFKLQDLHLPLLTADERLLKILKGCCERVLNERKESASSLVERIERLAADRLSKGEARIEIIATEMGMSQRTLARRLTEEGKGFRRIVDDLRHALALAYLKDSDLSIAEITFMLGYSEITSFNHAFKRWTGSSPSAVR